MIVDWFRLRFKRIFCVLRHRIFCFLIISYTLTYNYDISMKSSKLDNEEKYWMPLDKMYFRCFVFCIRVRYYRNIFSTFCVTMQNKWILCDYLKTEKLIEIINIYLLIYIQFAKIHWIIIKMAENPGYPAGFTPSEGQFYIS